MKSLTAWHLVFWALLGSTLLLSFLTEMAAPHRIGFVAALFGMALAHYFIGQPASISRRRLPSHLYRIILIALITFSAYIYPQSIFLLFIITPQMWLLSEQTREGVAYCVALLFAVGLAQIAVDGFSWQSVRENMPWMTVSLIASAMLGLWIERVINQSEQRAELIHELEAARDQLADAHHTAGVMAERERMAREIHDTLAQGMTSIVMLSQAAQVELQRGDTDPAIARLVAIEDTARENLAEARALVAAFTPIALSGANLTEVLRRQAARFAAETGVDVQVELDMADDEVTALPQGQQVVLLRAAQEALANVRKHAGATQVRIRLGISADGVGIEIRDDGQGFSPSELLAGSGQAAGPRPTSDSVGGSGGSGAGGQVAAGFGLAAMRGRVEESGGSVEVESTPGQGTRVQVLIPRTKPEAGE
ncbi:sensor histidine kinase [Kribbella deserti]|uniref:Oxygen sensor histidine kinase NreB n=1 Tax=Kribbella deserti TaxID=1926257 RepID=A0ABV6QG67_9ACTN